MTLLDRMRQWLATPRRRLIAGAAGGAFIAAAVAVSLVLAISGGDSEDTAAATAGPDGATGTTGSSPGNTRGPGATTGQPTTGDAGSPGATTGQGDGSTPGATTRARRPDPREFVGGEPPVKIPTVPPDQVNPTHPANPTAPPEATEVKPTPTPTPRIPQWVDPVAQPAASGRNYCDTKTQSHPPDGRVAGAIQVNGANAPDGTKVELAFDGTISASTATTKVDGSYAGYSLDVWASEDSNCANRAGAKIYVVVNGKWFDTGHTVGEGLGLYVLDVRA